MSTKSDRKRKKSVLICGAYGHGNAGDEAILDAIVAEMRALGVEEITVLSRRPEETAGRCGVQAIHSFSFFRMLRAMRQAGLYINGGGSLIQDVTSSRSLWYYLFTLAAAKKLGCRVMMYGCGIGPVRSEKNRRRTRRILNRYVDVITLREDDSLQELASYGVTEPEMIVSSDPSLSLPAASPDEVRQELLRRGIDPDRNYLCFALRRWPGFEEKAACFTEAARYAYQTYGLTPVFLSINHLNDGEASDCAARDLDIPCHIIREPMSSALTIGVMSRMKLVVSMRLHGLIFASSAGVPLIGISYDPKVRAFLRYIGQTLLADLNDITPEMLCGFIDRAVRMGREEQRELSAVVDRLREIESRNTEAAARLLGL